jgi:hypothetical protein
VYPPETLQCNASSISISFDGYKARTIQITNRMITSVPIIPYPNIASSLWKARHQSFILWDFGHEEAIP